MQKHFFSKNISVYAIFDIQSFKDTLINDIVSFEQVGPVVLNTFSFSTMHNAIIVADDSQIFF